MLRRIVLLIIAAAFAASALAQVAPANSHVYGKPLNAWLESYWRWYFATGGSDVYQPGVAPVVFMPMPSGTNVAEPGEMVWSQGTYEATLKPGTAFVLPFCAWMWEFYISGPDDVPFTTEKFMSTVHYPNDPSRPPVVTIDGKPAMANFWRYFSGDITLDPVIYYRTPTDYGALGTFDIQSVGVVVGPMSIGTHTLHLLEEMDVPEWGLAWVFDNTWVIHVVPPGKK